MRERNREDAEDREQDLEEEREVVARRELLIRVVARRVEPSIDRGPQRIGEPDDGDDRHRPAPAAPGQNEVHDDREQEKPGQRRDRCDLAEVGERLRPRVRHVNGHRASPAWPTEVIRFVSTYGYSPIANMIATRGASSVS